MKLIIAMIMSLMLVSSAYAVKVGENFVLDGKIMMGAVVAGSYDSMIGDIPVIPGYSNDEDSKGVFNVNTNIGITYKELVRPFFTFDGMTGVGSSDSFTFGQRLTTVGVETFAPKNWGIGNIGATFFYRNWYMKESGQVYDMKLTFEPSSETWVAGIFYKF